jgi:hypothetical protein
MSEWTDRHLKRGVTYKIKDDNEKGSEEGLRIWGSGFRLERMNFEHRTLNVERRMWNKELVLV